MKKMVLDDSIKERSSTIVINEEEDFIQECTIKKVELSEDGAYYAVEVENNDGRTLESRFYLPVDRGDEKKYEIACNIFLRNLKNILSRFSKNAVVEADTFEELTHKVIKLIDPKLSSRKVYTLFELTKNDNGIFTRIAGVAPFADNPKELFITKRQKALLEEKKGIGIKPDDDSIKFMNSSNPDEPLPWEK